MPGANFREFMATLYHTPIHGGRGVLLDRTSKACQRIPRNIEAFLTIVPRSHSRGRSSPFSHFKPLYFDLEKEKSQIPLRPEFAPQKPFTPPHPSSLANPSRSESRQFSGKNGIPTRRPNPIPCALCLMVSHPQAGLGRTCTGRLQKPN
jgi:hypothetical protein